MREHRHFLATGNDVVVLTKANMTADFSYDILIHLNLPKRTLYLGDRIEMYVAQDKSSKANE